MKVGELRNTIERYKPDQLKTLVVEMYKAMPKAVKEDQAIDDLISNPTSKRKARKRDAAPDIEVLRLDVETLIENAYSLCYLIPNRVVPKRERPQWRFTARRLYKQLGAVAADPGSLPDACSLLERLYLMLCRSCSETLFTAYDTFESVGISQAEFFERVLELNRRNETPRDFVQNSVLLYLENGLNRYTLYTQLMDVVLRFLDTPDMIQIAIAACDQIRVEAAKDSPRKGRRSWESDSYYADYAKQKAPPKPCHDGVHVSYGPVGARRRRSVLSSPLR